MVLDRLFGGRKIKFKCEFRECGSRCCRNNLVVLNEDDVKKFSESGISIEEITTQMELNQFLKTFGSPAMPVLEGLKVLYIKKDSSGNCVFLDADAGFCRIYDARPYLCREFPFILSKSKIAGQDASCAGLNKGEEMSFGELAEYIGVKNMERKPPYIAGEKAKTEMLTKVIGLMLRMKR